MALIDPLEVEAWIRAYVEPVGHIERVHERPWATVLRVPLAHGAAAWFKACPPAQAFEPWLTATLSARWPDRVVDVLGYDEERRWLLLADAGTPVGVFGNPPEAWLAALPLYAELQRAEAAHVHDHLAHGVPDLRLGTLPAQYDDLLRLDLPLEPDEVSRLRQRAPAFAELCRELAAYGVPETIQHDDLHHANLYVRPGAVREPGADAVRGPDAGAVRLPDADAVRGPRADALRLPDAATVRLQGGSAPHVPGAGACRLPDAGANREPGADALRLPDAGAAGAPGAHAVLLPDAGAVGVLGSGAVRVLDWGDASISHPFASLVVTFRFLEERTRLAPGDPWFGRLRDAYLEPWGRGLADACALAIRVGAVARAIACMRQRAVLAPAERQLFDTDFSTVLRRALSP